MLFGSRMQNLPSQQDTNIGRRRILRCQHKFALRYDRKKNYHTRNTSRLQSDEKFDKNLL